MKSKGKKGSENSQKPYFTPNTFSLRSIKPGISSKFDVEVEFETRSLKSEVSGDRDSQSQSQNPIIPKYNQDGNHLTPAFIIKDEKSFLELHDEYSEGSQFSKSDKQKEESELIMVAKPGSMYCKVCEASFIDYLNHIKRQDHISYVKRACKKIKTHQLILYFERKVKKEWKKSDSLELTEKKKRKMRIVQDSCSYTPSNLSKTNNQSNNNSSLLSNKLLPNNNPKLLQY